MGTFNKKKKMKLVLLALIALCLVATTQAAYGQHSCSYVTSKRCSRVRARPFHRRVKRYVTRSHRVKYIKNVRVSYRKRVCKPAKKRVYYNRPYRTTRRHRYFVNQRYTR